MSMERLLADVPEFAEDIKANLHGLFTDIPQTGLTDDQFFGVALVVSYHLNSPRLIQAIKATASPPCIGRIEHAAKIAATLMAMNNVYYRFVHLAEDDALKRMPAQMKMMGLKKHGISELDFELFGLAMSAMNACGLCITTHYQHLLKAGATVQMIQSSIRLAANLNAVNQAILIQELP